MHLENLKKQAKQYLRWHREGHPPVAEQIRTALDRYRQLTDAEILRKTFKLADAQELVARKHGFASWRALKEGMTPVAPGKRPEPEAILEGAEPQLFVADVEASRRFFAGLGFSLAFACGEPPFYAQVSRDGARLNLRRVAGPVIDRSRESDLLSATIPVRDAKPLYLEFQAAGVPFHQALRREPWGARTFIVRDPDGNLLLFAGREK